MQFMQQVLENHLETWSPWLLNCNLIEDMEPHQSCNSLGVSHNGGEAPVATCMKYCNFYCPTNNIYITVRR